MDISFQVHKLKLEIHFRIKAILDEVGVNRNISLMEVDRSEVDSDLMAN